MPDFELDGGRLAASGSLDADAEGELRDQCARLLLSGTESVKVDLSGVGSISSVCVGALVALWIDLCAAGRGMELQASPEVRRVLDIAGLGDVFSTAPQE